MSLKTKVQALLTAANAKTSASDATLTDAVQTLIDGYGQGGSSAQPQKDVNFIDYDGTILHSYTAAEFAALTALPANPDHSNDIQWGGHTIPLTSQGWNYTLAKAQTYVAKYGKLWVGQMYKPTDGKLHLCVRMGEGRLNPACRFTFSNGTATIDWGDGTTPTNAVSGADNEHTYAAAGDYDVAIAVSAGGKIGIAGDTARGCLLFQKPNTTDRNYKRVYQGCIRKVFIPDSVAYIAAYAFNNCKFLQSIAIHDSVSSISTEAISYSNALQSITIPDGVTNIKDSAFNSCSDLKSVAIPDGVTSIGASAFSACYNLKSIAIPDGVTSIGSRAFSNVYTWQSSITIPDGVTNIKDSAFSECYGLGSIRFCPVTPPTVASSYTFSNVPTDCKIYVPAASLTAYKAATNYPNPSTYTYAGY